MCNNWKTVPDSKTFTIEQNMRFHVDLYREKCQLDWIRISPCALPLEDKIWNGRHCKAMCYNFASK